MEIRFKKKSQLIDIVITAVAAVLSVGIMLYGISKFGLGEAWPELVLNLFYIVCLVLMAMFFFQETRQPTIQLLEFDMHRYYCAFARHTLSASA